MNIARGIIWKLQPINKKQLSHVIKSHFASDFRVILQKEEQIVHSALLKRISMESAVVNNRIVNYDLINSPIA